MAGNMRREVLRVFKKLHKTGKNVFHGDEAALKTVRTRINEEYRKNRHVKDLATICELNRFAEECEYELRTTVVRLVEKRPGVYEAQITKDTALVDNDKIGDFNQMKQLMDCSKPRKKK